MRTWEILEREGHLEVRQYFRSLDGDKYLISVLACATIDDAIELLRRWHRSRGDRS